MNPNLNQLQAYPFARLRLATEGISPPDGATPIPLHIGEPKHPTPKIITDALTANIDKLSVYPATAGLPELKQACAEWLHRRYDGLTVNAQTEVLPVLGSREALFSFVQTVINAAADKQPIVVCPNPFYQIYEGAALLAGARVVFANCNAPRFLPNWADISEADWQQTQLVFVCSPNNPSGAVMNQQEWAELFALQDQYGFIIASDECYSEIYFDQKPLGALQAAAQLGRGFDKLVMFTSLSKRSNAPGLRSGFVAGDAKLLEAFLLYRTYHGSAMSLPIQYASMAAWQDEQHVEENRRLYREKFAAILPILAETFEIQQPDASFYIWLKVPGGNDLAFTQTLWREAAIQVLPGRFLGRDTANGNAGMGYVRIALVAPLEQCIAAAHKIVGCAKNLTV
ncbi:succinyldiaminopimelate transaminase [Stenoxybacter acetivorans]|uniref:succinyldiaminopimelate transaminase n=1 Tax=Stenoxybacter acetivorans TaxID=422441 RepID=UPI00055C51F3|nr:succinyldiaminopimelate transaminase [Stenoxybacter acetivorans]